MDFAVFVPTIAIAFVVPGTVACVALTMGHVRKMNELKIRERELEMGGGDSALGRVVDALYDDLNDTRTQVAALQERLDFAERLLAGGSATDSDRGG